MSRPRHDVAAVVEDAEFLLRHRVHPDNAVKRLGYGSWLSLARTLDRAGRCDITRGFLALLPEGEPEMYGRTRKRVYR